MARSLPLLMLALGSSVLMVDLAQAGTTFTGQYRIVNKNSGKALDISDLSMFDGGNIQQWDYVGGNNQKWTLTPSGAGYYIIKSVMSGKVVDISGGSNADGANVQQWTSNGTNAQQFKIEDLGAGLYRITNRGSGKVLDVAGFSTANGGNVHQWSWANGNNQKWEIIPVDADTSFNGTYSIRSSFNARALDVKEASTANAAPVHTWDYVGGTNQQWKLEAAGSGYYRVRAAHSNQLLDIGNASMADSANVQQYPENGNDAQLFAFIRSGDSYMLRNKNSGKVIDIQNWNNYNGAPVVQYSATGQDNQRWKVAKATTSTTGGGSARCTNLKWADEFNYSGLPDASKWSFEVHTPGWVNHEWQNYTDRRLENARVENGRLILEARRDWYNGYEISSARLASNNKADFTYGRFESRIKLPAGRGVWPAFWMLPTDWSYGGWPDSGEIDIMEHVGYDPGMIYGSAHTRDRNHTKGTQFTRGYADGSVESSFHNYAVEWFPDHIDYYFDSNKYATYKNDYQGYGTWPFDKRFYMILNLAIGGDWGAAQGVDMNIFPARMEVDYVRVFGCN